MTRLQVKMQFACKDGVYWELSIEKVTVTTQVIYFGAYEYGGGGSLKTAPSKSSILGSGGGPLPGSKSITLPSRICWAPVKKNTPKHQYLAD